ncbi:hypothetical protein GFS31_40970 (plasmid) [Leptolyngbya sp. BL0902]|nr:hypothetical protein GFS31_40970 [Leptolyngbya sp. BL0902]
MSSLASRESSKSVSEILKNVVSIQMSSLASRENSLLRFLGMYQLFPFK